MSSQQSWTEAAHRALQDLLPWYASGSLPESEAVQVQEHLRTCASCRADLAWQRKLLETEGALPAGLDAERALARLMPQLTPPLTQLTPSSASTPSTASSSSTPSTPSTPSTASPSAKPALAPTSLLTPALPLQEAPSPSPALAAKTDLPPAAAGVPPRRQDARPLGARLRGWLAWCGGWQYAALAAQFAVIAFLAWPGNEAPASYQALGQRAADMPDLMVVFKPEARVEDVQRLLQTGGARIVGGPTVTGAYMLDVDAARQPALLAALRADPAVDFAETLAPDGGRGAQP